MSWLLANSVVAAVMALVVLAIGRCRPAPAVMHGLWLFVLLKLVTPPLFTVPVDVAWWNAPAVDERPVVVPLTFASASLVGDDAPSSLPAPLVVPHVLPPPVAATTKPPASPPVTLQQFLLVGWALGSLLMLAWFVVGLWRGARRLRALGPVSPSLTREIATLAARLGVRPPQLRDDPAAGSPYVWSFGCTRLVVPARTLAAATPKGRAAVLAHELAHLRRGDHWLAQGELLLAVVLWWHPLFWFARARLRLWAELACDAWAVASVPDATLDYATVLVQAVAAPDSAVPAPAVLSARPAARAAFERRLTMILNENVPCRASRAWWLPFTSLALGLFTMPVAAQNPPRDPAKVEIRVNGKSVDELSAAERKALLKKLLAAEEGEQDPAPKKAAKSGGKTGKAVKAKVHVEAPAHEAHAEHGEHAPHGGHAGAPSAKEIHEMMKLGLAEARVEIEADEDLRELGITDEVGKLIDDVAGGKGLGGLDAVIKAAMKGAGKMVEKELAADKDLRELGLTDGITKMVKGLLADDRMQEMISDFAMRTAERAMKDAKQQVLADPELHELGIEVDVAGLMDSLFSGKGSFDVKLQHVIDKAMQGAMKKFEFEFGDEPIEVLFEGPAPKAAKKSKKGKRDDR